MALLGISGGVRIQRCSGLLFLACVVGVGLKKPCPAVLLRDGQGRHAVIKKMGYHWHLRKLMADQQMFQTSDLVPLLAERGVVLSREQVYLLVTQPPQRLSMDTLVALCDILNCTPNDLIQPEAVNTQLRKTADTDSSPAPAVTRPRVIRRPGRG